jgi:hypothetical protein
MIVARHHPRSLALAKLRRSRVCRTATVLQIWLAKRFPGARSRRQRTSPLPAPTSGSSSPRAKRLPSSPSSNPRRRSGSCPRTSSAPAVGPTPTPGCGHVCALAGIYVSMLKGLFVKCMAGVVDCRGGAVCRQWRRRQVDVVLEQTVVSGAALADLRGVGGVGSSVDALPSAIEIVEAVVLFVDDDHVVDRPELIRAASRLPSRSRASGCATHPASGWLRMGRPSDKRSAGYGK